MNQVTNITSKTSETMPGRPPEPASTTVAMAPQFTSRQGSASDAKPAPKPAPKPVLSGFTQADALLVHKVLIAQDDGLARRSDLTELHKRIAQMLQSLNKAMGDSLGEALAEKAAEDRAGLEARIDTLEEAVNRMEGALRIEFEPVLCRAIAKVSAEQAKPPRRLARGAFWTSLVLVTGLVLGAAYQGELLEIAQQVLVGLAAIVAG